MNDKKKHPVTSTPIQPHTWSPAYPYGYPHVRQNSWIQNLTFEIMAKNSHFSQGAERDMA